ncbi:TonB-dependent receptor [Wohlfahrtiimonas chitiniclastica]|uniref:TonB-dependent receptor plug domain-containing protein n=1 Tax=Wohlfahrtiimonas chitiniclastica TaxID=400946 RepID=UPI000B99000D|nr:TonB-dependent receptor [Wohlfahrtiimonas chitiniclastica]OYQ80242.1 TonB-dependent receptor [Wohlfahrtiimonas chitiniclastica]
MQYPSPRFTLTKVAAAVILCTSGMAMADENKAEHSNIFTLGTVVVTADAITTAESSESFIDRETIELLEAKDLGQALQYTPGVFYDSPIGAAGGRSARRFEPSVSIRGYSLRYVPIFVDGIPVYIPYDGYSDMSRFTTADVSSIQVAKGYSSVMYGHNTMGGAINIVTLKPRSAFDFSGTLGTATGDVKEISANVGTLQENWYLQVGASERTRKYSRLAEKFDGKDGTNRQVDSDQYLYHTKDRRANIKVGWTPNATDEYVLSYSKQEAKKYPGTGNGIIPTEWIWPKWDRETISFVSQTWLFDDQVYIKPRIYHDGFKNTLLNFKPNQASHYDDKAFGASLEVGTTAVQNHLFKLMLSYKRETHKGIDQDLKKMTQEETKATQKFYSIALEDTITFNEQWEAQVGAIYTKRKADADGIGANTQALIGQYPAARSLLAPSMDATDFQAALFYKPSETDTFRITAGKKTRFPSFKEVYSNYGDNAVNCKDKKFKSDQRLCPVYDKTPIIALQNPGLKPESAINIDLGYSGMPIEGLHLDATLFYSQSKNVIAREENNPHRFPGYIVNQTINLSGKVERKGLELGLDYDINRYVRLGGGYTYLDMKNKDSHEHVTDTPKHFGYLYATFKPIDWFEITPSMTARSSSYAFAHSNEKNKGYQVYNLKISVTPPQWKGVSFNAGVDNIFNKDYAAYNASFPSEGRSFYANMRIDFY